MRYHAKNYREFARSPSHQTCGNKVRLATHSKTRRKSKTTNMGFPRGTKYSQRAKIKTCTFLQANILQNSSEYPNHLSVLSRVLCCFFPNNLSRNSCKWPMCCPKFPEASPEKNSEGNTASSLPTTKQWSKVFRNLNREA